MGNRRRPRRPVGPAHDVGHGGLDCGCEQLVQMEMRVTCAACGRQWTDVAALPSSGGIGDEREVWASCACGGDAQGVGIITGVFG